jgi:hypothetical protein
MGKTNNNMSSKKSTSSALTRQAFMSMLNARREKKYNDNAYSGTLTTSGSVSFWTENIAQGDSSSTRDGAQIELIMLKLYYSFTLATTLTATARIIVFIDTMNEGTVPVVTDILTSASVSSNYTRDVEIVKRYHILYDQSHSLTLGATTSTIIKYQKIRCRRILSYNGTTVAAGSNGKNAVFTLRITNESSNNLAYNISQGTLYYDS